MLSIRNYEFDSEPSFIDIEYSLLISGRDVKPLETVQINIEMSISLFLSVSLLIADTFLSLYDYTPYVFNCQTTLILNLKSHALQMYLNV